MFKAYAVEVQDQGTGRRLGYFFCAYPQTGAVSTTEHPQLFRYREEAAKEAEYLRRGYGAEGERYSFVVAEVDLVRYAEGFPSYRFEAAAKDLADFMQRRFDFDRLEFLRAVGAV